ncbi:MAG: type IV secretion system DNA-binding domain-containing protein [Chloroflexi bacterium]|nr:type IV secretion system DNA-binding domain-containing protein [Chloroflexota bacterium]
MTRLAFGGRATRRTVASDDGAPKEPTTIRAYLAPEHHWALPLRTDLLQDPAALLDRGFADQAADERVVVRFLVARADARRQREALVRAAQLRAGRRLSDGGLGRTVLRETGGALREMLAFGLTGQTYTPTPPGSSHELQAQAQAVERKAHRPLLSMQIQIRVQAGTKAAAEQRLTRLLACIEPTAGVFNRLVLHRPWRKQRFDRGWATADWWPGASFVVSHEEAHALTGRPLLEFETLVGIKVWTRQAGRYGDVPQDRGLRLGRVDASTDGSASGRACIRPQDALKHALVVGPTGVGKSTFLYWWARSVMDLGHGLLVLDPKGDLISALLTAVPPHRTDDTILLDFADTDWPAALNPLDVRDAFEGGRVAAAVYAMMKELVRGEDLHWGTSMSQAFMYGFRTLAANPQIQPTMLDLERLFFDRDWRQTLLPQVSDPFLQSYWKNQVDRTSIRQFELTFGGALRRMAMLVQDPRVRNILVQPHSAVAWDKVLARGQLVLANLDQADTALGAAGSRLLGSILVTQFWQAVLRRPEDRRPSFFAVFDEFQEFLDTGRDMAAFFERSRSYGVGLTVATQNPGHPRLRPILDSVLINTRTHVVFGGLRNQVRHFTDEMAPTFTKQQLDDLPAYHMAITTLVDNRPARPFMAAVEPIPAGDPALAAQLRTHGRRRVGQPRAQIERLVAARYGQLPDDAKRRTKNEAPGSATPPNNSSPGPLEVNDAEPLDGQDPNPRAGA